MSNLAKIRGKALLCLTLISAICFPSFVSAQNDAAKAAPKKAAGQSALIPTDQETQQQVKSVLDRLSAIERWQARGKVRGQLRNLMSPAVVRKIVTEEKDPLKKSQYLMVSGDLDDKTLVVFTADQGLAGGHSGFWGMGDHTRPLTAYDWTMHIPLIFRQPGGVAAGRRSDLLVSNYDFFPSLLHYLGLEEKLPTEPKLPGRNFAPLLRGESITWDNVVSYEFENVRALRTDRWKYIERIHQEPNELYDLRNDAGERNNLYGKAQFAEVQQQLKMGLDRFFQRYADPKWDLWHGGKSKSGLITEKLFQQSL